MEVLQASTTVDMSRITVCAEIGVVWISLWISSVENLGQRRLRPMWEVSRPSTESGSNASLTSICAFQPAMTAIEI
jgi:hypothetical protein